MKIKNNCATVIVAILFLFIICSNSEEEAHYDVHSLLPNCILGVKSISYILHTRDNVGGIRLNTNDVKLPFRAGRVIFLIHGFISEANNSEYFSFAEDWLRQEDVNIISVDWDDAACNGGLSIADVLSYESAVTNVPVVGRDIAQFTINVARTLRLAINKIIIFGHSLGAHAAGFAGKHIQKLASGHKYAAIIGLDPAGPSFRDKGCKDRLCNTDASRVIAIHTSRTFGFHNPIADADFYFNGGTGQPGCNTIKRITCDHTRAVIYAKNFVLQPACYQGTRWQLDSKNILNPLQCRANTCAYAGLDAVRNNAKGIYYVSPSSEPPYCNA